MLFAHEHTNTQNGGYGLLIIDHQGELNTGDELRFEPQDVALTGYGFTLQVPADTVITRTAPSDVKVNIQGHQVVIAFPRLQMSMATDVHNAQWKPAQRYLFTYSSVVDAATTWHFTVSLQLDANPRHEAHYHFISPDQLPKPWTPDVHGVWYRLTVWADERATTPSFPDRLPVN